MMETVVAVEPQDVAHNRPPVEVEPKVAVSAPVVGLPKASCSWTVIGPRVGLEDAAPETGAEVMTNFEGDPAVMVSIWVALVSAPEAVMVGVPDLVSP